METDSTEQSNVNMQSFKKTAVMSELMSRSHTHTLTD